MANNNNILVINGNEATYIETVAPKLITNNETFFKALNTVLISRYKMDYELRLEKSRKNFNDTTKKLAELVDKKSEEYKELSAKVKTAKEKKERFEAIYNSIKAEEKTMEKMDTPEEIKDIITFYAILYSSVAGIDLEKNKVKSFVITGMKNLFSLCKNYADKYENTGDEWNETRKEEFRKIRTALEAIGARLNGEATENRKGFKYSASSKDVFRLIAFATKRDTHSKTSGKFEEKRNSFENFQHTAVCTIFRMKNEDISFGDEVEC